MHDDETQDVGSSFSDASGADAAPGTVQKNGLQAGQGSQNSHRVVRPLVPGLRLRLNNLYRYRQQAASHSFVTSLSMVPMSASTLEEMNTSKFIVFQCKVNAGDEHISVLLVRAAKLNCSGNAAV